ncbi:MAG: histidine phosphatase family protein [Nocardioidaceae bacterium]
MPRLHLVWHGRPQVDPTRPPDEWALDPAGFDAIDALRHHGRLPHHVPWFSSPERKALDTARRLTDGLLSAGDVTVVPELREHARGVTPWFDDVEQWRALVGRVFEEPDRPALAGWEPLTATRDRVVPAVRRLLAGHPGQELVLCGHGTAWTMLVAELTGRPADLAAWAALRMPDHWVVELDTPE